MIPKGVGIDQTWPEFCKTDAWTTLGALFAAQVRNNEPAIIMASRPMLLTMLPSTHQTSKNNGRPPIRPSRIFVAQNMATIRRNIGFAPESAEAEIML